MVYQLTFHLIKKSDIKFGTDEKYNAELIKVFGTKKYTVFAHDQYSNAVCPIDFVPVAWFVFDWQQFEQLAGWTAENIKNTYKIVAHRWIFFENVDDAMLFKLRWIECR